MKISSLYLSGFRNFKSSRINFNSNTLVIGVNDIGKSNMLYALRILLDKNLSDADIEPTELDFCVSGNEIFEQLEITIKFEDVNEDAVISVLKGYVSDSNETYLRYVGQRSDLSYKLYAGHSLDSLEEINARFYLKHLSLKYIQSQRDLDKFIRKEKRQLLKIAQQELTSDQRKEDEDLLSEIGSDLLDLNEKISDLIYVNNATSEINNELKKLAYHYSDYSVSLDAGAIRVNDFIDRLQLGARVNGSNIMLGGDGRNNQILLALWKAKSIQEHDIENEVIFYVIEEPEAHLHPHQQRKLSSYLIKELPGQAIISSHSPQIAVNFKPESIVRLLKKDGTTVAAGDGCSSLIEEKWEDMSYRMSIIPAEAFFSNGVLLVEGPSEILFYNRLAKDLKIDLDYENISLLSVDGISFKIYSAILSALEIPWSMRTDNDVSKVKGLDAWRYAGVNRCLNIVGKQSYPNSSFLVKPQDLVNDGTWNRVSDEINSFGVYLSKVDLETDLIDELGAQVIEALGRPDKEKAIKHLQGKKALRMRMLVMSDRIDLCDLESGDLAKPLLKIVSLARME